MPIYAKFFAIFHEQECEYQAVYFEKETRKRLKIR